MLLVGIPNSGWSRNHISFSIGIDFPQVHGLWSPQFSIRNLEDVSMTNITELVEFLNEKMRMTGVYQLVMKS